MNFTIFNAKIVVNLVGVELSLCFSGRLFGRVTHLQGKDVIMMMRGVSAIVGMILFWSSSSAAMVDLSDA